MKNGFIGFDFETVLFAPGKMAPEPVSLSVAFSPDIEKAALFHTQFDPVADVIEEMLKDDREIVGHNTAFDMSVIWKHYPQFRDLIIKAYRENRVTDTMLRQQLLDYAEDRYRPKYDLGSIAAKFFGVEMDKGNTGWRLRYEELWNVRIKDWPVKAYKYAVEDAYYTLKLAMVQHFNAEKRKYTLPTEHFEARAAFALQQMSVRGFAVDGKRVEAFKKYCDAGINNLRYRLFTSGMHEIRLKRDQKWWEENKDTGNSREEVYCTLETQKVKRSQTKMRDFIEEVLGPGAERSDKTNAIKVDKKAVMKTHVEYQSYHSHLDGSPCDGEDCEDDSHWMEAHLVFENLKKFRKTYIKVLEAAALGEVPIHAGFRCLGASSARTSAFRPNIQNQPKQTGIRECFKARDGHALIACDYDSQEMRMFAQRCLDLGISSTLAERFTADPGFDPHTYFAGVVLGYDYKEAMLKKLKGDSELLAWRQRAKVANFGFLGGMGASKLRLYAEGYGMSLNLKEASELKEHFFTVWPETKPYFEFVSKQMQCHDHEGNEYGFYESPKGFRRACRYYTQYANTGFQTLAAHATKEAMWDVWLEMQNTESDLYGSYLLAMIHDELIIESPGCMVAKAAKRLEEIMVAAQERNAKGVPAACESVAMTHWSKNAEIIMNDKGLQVYQVPWSCYRPTGKKDCGVCPACKVREKNANRRLH